MQGSSVMPPLPLHRLSTAHHVYSTIKFVAASKAAGSNSFSRRQSFIFVYTFDGEAVGSRLK